MSTAADSVVRYSPFFTRSEVRTVLDYGAGTLRNAVYLMDRGFTVYAADLHEQVKVLRGHPAAHRLAGLLEVRELERSRLGVDMVISTYVFNIINPKAKRRRYLDNVVANLRPEGYLLMEVSSKRDAGEYLPAAGGYLACDSYVKTYTHSQMDRLLAPYGFQRICHHYSNHALAALYQLGGTAY